MDLYGLDRGQMVSIDTMEVVLEVKWRIQPP